MIKFIGTKEDDGTAVIGFVLSPGNLERLIEGQPILVDLHGLAAHNGMASVIPGPLEILISYEADFKKAARVLTQQAVDDGAKIHVVQKGPGEPQ